MIKARVGDRFDDWLKALCPFLFRWSVNPNWISVMGAATSVASAVFLARGAFIWGGVLILASGCFDLVDGALARHQGRTTVFGGFLDSTLDRFADMAVLLGILLHYAGEGAIGLVLLVGVTLIVTVLVSYVKARAEAVVVRLRSGLFERGERVLILAFGGIFGMMPAALVLIALGSTITVIQRIMAAYRQMRDLDARVPRGVMEAS